MPKDEEQPIDKSRMPEDDATEQPIFDRTQIAEKYVAFVDFLGFAGRVLNNFTEVLNGFEEFLKFAGMLGTEKRPGVQITVYSDSYLLVSSELAPMLMPLRMLHMHTLFNNYLIRGGVAHGRHVQADKTGNLYVVSEALTKAAMIEKTIRFPCVALHEDIQIPDNWWTGFERNIDRPLLYFGGRTIINPCNLMWGYSAGTRVRQMLEESPQHREKYLWFLEMHQAVFSPVPMVPPRFFKVTK